MLEDPERMYEGAYLPHCEAAGRPQLITTRLGDSLPTKVYRRLLEEASSQTERRALTQRYLDGGRGRCLLQHPRAAKIVAEAIRFYDSRHYDLVEWVVMPNHIHIAYRNPTDEIGKICGDLKSYTASRINESFDRSGSLWQTDFFDRYARNPKHLCNMRFYTLLNPVRAGLVDDPFDWPWSSIHDYSAECKGDLRRWYRHWRERFWRAIV